ALPADGTNGSPQITPVTAQGGDRAQPLPTEVPAHGVLALRAVIDNITDDGDGAIDLLNKGTKFAKLTIRRAPSGLTLNTPASADARLVARDAETVKLLVSTPDPTAYSFTWHLSAAGTEVCTPANVSMQPRSSLVLQCVAEVPFSLERVQDLFRSTTA